MTREIKRRLERIEREVATANFERPHVDMVVIEEGVEPDAETRAIIEAARVRSEQAGGAITLVTFRVCEPEPQPGDLQ